MGTTKNDVGMTKPNEKERQMHSTNIRAHGSWLRDAVLQDPGS